MWIHNGGKETLISYGLIKINLHDGRLELIKNDKAFEKFCDDITWIKTLPLYIELEQTKEEKPIVVSHANIADVWHFRDDDKNQRTFVEHALWKRNTPRKDVEIFNIFGNTIQGEVDITQHYINVDTGCYYIKQGYGKLSAYFIETGYVINT